MPLYVVRWPSFNISLVKARNEDEPLNMLDEEAYPGGCCRAVYRGPVWVNFDLPLDVSCDAYALPSAKEMQVQGIDEAAQSEVLPYEVSIGVGDAADEMRDALTAFAFPHLQRVFAEISDESTDSPHE